ncbi:hypothetical protein [Nonomuraea longicatena]|uniref:Polyketide cyclase n=1 Tax=Nonomuraea longicatena TaxID=83682 RepID=A0ABN1PUI8_9ACTN
MEQQNRRRLLAGVLAALFAAMLGHRVLHTGHLEQSALFYVGLPAVIALTVALVARPRSALGVTMVTITIGLALSGPLLGEGIVCLVVAAPIFYFVGAVMVGVVHLIRKGTNAVVVPLLLLVALEGATEGTSLPREETVSVTRAHSGELAAALAAPPVFGGYDSVFLRLGFPRPARVTGEGLQVGATREVVFDPRRSLGIGAVAEPRSMTLRVVSSSVPADPAGSGRVVFAVERDTTLARWLDLRTAAFTWADGRLTVSLDYRRTFDPAWYFGPVQRYAVGEAADYLASAFTRP